LVWNTIFQMSKWAQQRTWNINIQSSRTNYLPYFLLCGRNHNIKVSSNIHSFICITNKAWCSIPNEIKDIWGGPMLKSSLTIKNPLFYATHILLHIVLIIEIANVCWISLVFPIDCFIVHVNHLRQIKKALEMLFWNVKAL
jgi:hypothetical protein